MGSCTCSFSSLVDQCSPCGTSSDYPTHVKVVTLTDCSRDVLRHLESYGISGDEAINSELKLLLARAGILFTFSIVLRCSIKLCNGLSSWSMRGKKTLPLIKAHFCRAELNCKTVARQKIFCDSDVVPQLNKNSGFTEAS